MENSYWDYEYPISYTVQGREHFDDDSFLTHNYTPDSGTYNDWVDTSRYPGYFAKTWGEKVVPYLGPKSTRKSFLGYEPMSDDDDAHEATKNFINKKVGSKGIRVAKEMNKGNGEYIKGKGWR